MRMLRLAILPCLALATSVSLAQSTAAGIGFVHAPVLSVDGEAYFFAGAPDGPDGAQDVPGHY